MITSAAHTSSKLPHVACVLITRDRRVFVVQAVHYFLRQDYAARSLIVIDDGEESAEDAVRAVTQDDQRVRYVRLEPGRRSRGEKRNHGCKLAPDGALIAHWDDDDWIAPDRLSRQIRALTDTGADLCAARDVLHYRPSAGMAWRERGALCAPTLLYRKTAWEATGLAERTGDEEQPLLASLSSERITTLAAPDFYVVVLHDGNTIGRNPEDSQRWGPASVDGEVWPLLAADASFYAGLRNHRARSGVAINGSGHESSTALAADHGVGTSITLVAPFFVYDGYGSMAEHLAIGLDRAGARVNVKPLMLDLNGTAPAFRSIVERSRPEPGAPILYFSWPSPQLESLLPAPGGLFVNTMWEGTRLPDGWAGWINRGRAAIVPTTFVAEVFRASGVHVPIVVIPEGLDPAVYRYVERPPRSGLTTLMVGPVAPRKNTLEGIAAWKAAFAGDPDARLMLKARFRHSTYTPDDARISLIDDEEPSRGIAHWYARADILLALGSEGFGLPLVEGMATGLPVIALDAAGQSDTIRAAGDHRVLSVAAARWVAYDPADPACGGLRPVPDVAQVVDRLRWVADHRDAARDLGRAAADWARRERDVGRKAPAVLDVMEDLSRPRVVLRQAVTLWTPSRGESCGVAEYATHLSAALATDGAGRPVRHTNTAPSGRMASLVHAQHESSLFPDDAAFTEQVRSIRRGGVPVVITEHTVPPVWEPTRNWEHEADALVALTEAGAQRMRDRLSHKRVEWIPPGCPNFFPPRKRGRGRTLGAFGFLSPHKGFWRLLSLLRSHPEFELLLFSHARYPEAEARWEHDARGVAVRRVSEFLPLEEIAGRLAAEADALVFWYDEFSHESASYAVRIGLATGVPLVCSPTGWFRDVRDVTFQPPTASDADLAEGVKRVLSDDDLRDRLSEAARDYCQRHRWPEIARRHRALWAQLS